MLYAFLAALLYALNTPFSKLMLQNVQPRMMAALLYLGAGIGIFILRIVRNRKTNTETEEKLSQKDIPYIVAMIVLDTAAPVLLMVSLTMASAANISLLTNFEIAATAIFAVLLFREHVSNKLWLSIAAVTVASLLLSFEGTDSFSFSAGSLYALGAAVCWGLENCVTRTLSYRDPMEITIIKGFGAGSASLVLAFISHESIPELRLVFFALILGFAAYGLSIVLYISEQRYLGAARTSACYAVSPFISTALSLVIFHEMPSFFYWIALAAMIFGTVLSVTDH